MTTKRAIVTGSGGFLGSRLVASLRSQGWQVRCVRRESGELRWDQLGQAEVDGSETVFHLAAHVPRNMEDPGEARKCLEVNALLTLRLVEWMRLYPRMPLIFASTGQVYGPSIVPVNETANVETVSRACFYLSSKILAETYVRRAVRLHGLSAAILRIGSVYGPGMRAESLLEVFRALAAENRPLPLRNGGEDCFDLVHIDDVVACFIRAAETNAKGIFHVGTGTAHSVAEIAEMVNAAYGNSAGVVTETESRGEGSQGFAALSMAKSGETLGVQPRSLVDGLMY